MSFKFNPFTETFDIFSPDNFSYENITGTVTIPTNQQMIVYRNINISGTLLNNGSLVVSDFINPFQIINTATTETIDLNGCHLIRQTSSGITTSLSNAKIGSRISITNMSGASNTLNITIQGTASPTISDKETFSLVYNGTDYDFV